MELEQRAKIIDSIHKKLIDCAGTRLRVKANLGRSRVIECEGVVMQVHSSHFLMELERKRGRLSRQCYQYVDILTGQVELSHVESRESLFPILVEVQ